MSAHMPPTHPAPRQAVVIIHGIGEQRPMATLRSFVSALLDRLDRHGHRRDRPGERYYSKPDTISDSYELRRIKLHRAEPDDQHPDGLNVDWPETDFYEYYWAHQMYGTKVSHVVRWLLLTLGHSWLFMRAAGTEFPRLQRLAILAWLAIGLAIVAVATFVYNTLRFDAAAWAVGGVVGLLALWRYALRYFWQAALLDFVGDAARYFDVNPTNVARRYDILRGGKALLRRLHEERDLKGDQVLYRYGRIVVVGHSLGSVIAYDVLRHYWGELNGLIPVDRNADEIKGVEGFAASKKDPPPSDVTAYSQVRRYWSAQHTLWKAIRDRVPSGKPLCGRDLWRLRTSFRTDRGDQPAADDDRPRDWQPARWLVSDLVTLGSPLAHAPVLLAAGRADLHDKLGFRELPMCPPDRSKSVNIGHYTVNLASEASRFDNYFILHHGACFASTRWTNLWYSNDPVGGPLGAAFGSGIRDIHLPDAPFWPWKAHVSYWQRLTLARRSKGIRILVRILRDGHGHAKSH